MLLCLRPTVRRLFPPAASDSPVGGFGTRTWYVDTDLPPGESRTIELTLRAVRLGTDYQLMTSPATGIFQAAVRDGYVVAEGGLLGTLMDFFGDPIQEIRPPFTGVVISVIATPPISEGELMVMKGRIK